MGQAVEEVPHMISCRHWLEGKDGLAQVGGQLHPRRVTDHSLSMGSFPSHVDIQTNVLMLIRESMARKCTCGIVSVIFGIRRVLKRNTAESSPSMDGRAPQISD